ncbi:MAG: di-trans,poly-cis-decaprenylcistransferase [Spirochaetales bacterium]|nr:di-trans,poly-cis-decaprenylcistransferase [Candidatus Physcosoma equi]
MRKLNHLALIMDGNGRWATSKGLKRSKGHEAGAYAAEKVAKGCIQNGISFLTLYCFSTENWKRPEEEVNYLMGLLASQLVANIPKFNKLGIRVVTVGSRENMPALSLAGIDTCVKATKNNTTLTVQLAINYGGLDELARAANKALAAGVTGFEPDTLSQFVDNPFIPEPDMICRSAGEQRLSGFMLMQSNYAEFGFYDKLWPDWDESMVDVIVNDYNQRVRKFGGLVK